MKTYIASDLLILKKRYFNASLFLGYLALFNFIGGLFAIYGTSTYALSFNFISLVLKISNLRLSSTYYNIISGILVIGTTLIYTTLLYFVTKKDNKYCLYAGMILYFIDLFLCIPIFSSFLNIYTFLFSIFLHIFFLTEFTFAIIYKLKIEKILKKQGVN